MSGWCGAGCPSRSACRRRAASRVAAAAACLPWACMHGATSPLSQRGRTAQAFLLACNVRLTWRCRSVNVQLRVAQSERPRGGVGWAGVRGLVVGARGAGR